MIYVPYIASEEERKTSPKAKTQACFLECRERLLLVVQQLSKQELSSPQLEAVQYLKTLAGCLKNKALEEGPWRPLGADELPPLFV